MVAGRDSASGADAAREVVTAVVHAAQIADVEQAEEFRSFVRHCSKAMFLFDIGAHFGVFSLTVAHFGGKSPRFTLEPRCFGVESIAL